MPLHRSTHAIGVVGLLATLAVVAVSVAMIVSPKVGRKMLGVTPPPPTCAYRVGGALPAQKCTPGVVNHAVTQATIHKTICVKGWTGTIRPPLSVTEPQKFKSMREYGNLFGTSARAYEYDHLIPLELGGAPDDARNLWPEPHHVLVGGKEEGSYVKDGIENSLNAAVCSGKISLATARREIRTDWTKITTP